MLLELQNYQDFQKKNNKIKRRRKICSSSPWRWWKVEMAPTISDSFPARLHMERVLCRNTSLLALLNSPSLVNKSRYSNNFVVDGS